MKAEWKAEKAKPRAERQRCVEACGRAATPGSDYCWRCWDALSGRLVEPDGNVER